MKKLISLILALVMLMSLAACNAAFCEEGTAPEGTEAASTSAAGPDTHVFGGDEYPARFDLRDLGVVTPVKEQAPWNTCWSFGGIAAAEISILSTLGMTCEDYEKAAGKPFDLSEKHLAWFASRPITAQTNESQAGEGIYATGNENNPNAAYSTGGKGIFITTLFAAGVGPVYEEYFPYQGREGLTSAEFNEKYSDKVRADALAQFEKNQGLTGQGLTLEQLYEKRAEMADTFRKLLDTLWDKGTLDKSVSAENVTYEELEEASIKSITQRTDKDIAKGIYYYSNSDDWTIPDTAGDGSSNRDVYSGFTLVEGNILPPLSNRDNDNKWVGINEAGMRAVKSELLKGRGVSISYYADQSKPEDEIRKDGYMNLNTWAQYTDDDKIPNHAVCIVGWDDSYPKENFNEGHLPEGDGAWIVKNSWGSETEYTVREDGTPIGKNAWGIRNEEGLATGYFYLSYYDKNIYTPESMAFDTDLARADGLMSVFAYDYMPELFAENNANYKVQDVNVLRTANVFTNTTDREVAVYAVSTKTANPRARVEYALYRLNENAQNPEDGECVGKRLAFYDYAGFHRELLAKGDIRLKPGEQIAVVVTESVIDNNGVRQYEFAANQSCSKETAQKIGSVLYGIAVVNKGESFVYENGRWTDWFDYEKKPEEKTAEQMALMGIEPSEVAATDNFSIKIYVVADAETAE